MGEPIVASPGRFGPYVKHGNEFRSLDNEEQLFTVTLDEAVELLRAAEEVAAPAGRREDRAARARSASDRAALR